MAKSVARKWLTKHARTEYRLSIYSGASGKVRNLPSLLKSFRDGKIKMGSVIPIGDLGIKEGFDNLVVWSSNREALVSLENWLNERSIETSGIW